MTSSGRVWRKVQESGARSVTMTRYFDDMSFSFLQSQFRFRDLLRLLCETSPVLESGTRILIVSVRDTDSQCIGLKLYMESVAFQNYISLHTFCQQWIFKTSLNCYCCSLASMMMNLSVQDIVLLIPLYYLRCYACSLHILE